MKLKKKSRPIISRVSFSNPLSLSELSNISMY